MADVLCYGAAVFLVGFGLGRRTGIGGEDVWQWVVALAAGGLALLGWWVEPRRKPPPCA